MRGPAGEGVNLGEPRIPPPSPPAAALPTATYTPHAPPAPPPSHASLAYPLTHLISCSLQLSFRFPLLTSPPYPASLPSHPNEPNCTPRPPQIPKANHKPIPSLPLSHHLTPPTALLPLLLCRCLLSCTSPLPPGSPCLTKTAPPHPLLLAVPLCPSAVRHPMPSQSAVTPTSAPSHHTPPSYSVLQITHLLHSLPSTSHLPQTLPSASHPYLPRSLPSTSHPSFHSVLNLTPLLHILPSTSHLSLTLYPQPHTSCSHTLPTTSHPSPTHSPPHHIPDSHCALPLVPPSHSSLHRIPLHHTLPSALLKPPNTSSSQNPHPEKPMNNSHPSRKQ